MKAWMRSVFGIGTAGLLASSAALADLDTIFTIEATNDTGTGSWGATVDDADYDPDTDTWTWATGQVDLFTDDGRWVASLVNAGTTYIGDPQISLSFAVVAGNSDTNFTVLSGDLAVGLSDPDTLASASLTLTDQTGDGADLSGNTAGGGGYRASYDAQASTFASFIPSITTFPFGSTSDSDSLGFITVGGFVADMTAEYSFTLSANDAASGTSTYVIVPEPAGLLALFGFAMLLRRR